MEKLQRRSDGFYETPTGLLGIAPRVASGVRDGTSWFEFKATHLSDVIRVEWPQGAPVITLEADTAKTMMTNGYAFNINDTLMANFNAQVDAYLAAMAAPAAPAAPAPAAPAPEPTPEPAPTAPVAPVAPEAPAAPVAPPSEPAAPPAPPEAPEAEAKGKKGK